HAAQHGPDPLLGLHHGGVGVVLDVHSEAQERPEHLPRGAAQDLGEPDGRSGRERLATLRLTRLAPAHRPAAGRPRRDRRTSPAAADAALLSVPGRAKGADTGTSEKAARRAVAPLALRPRALLP